MARISRFKKRISDRSGFDYYERSMVKDAPWTVGAEELDAPPLSKRSTGGEGDIAAGELLMANSYGIVQITSTLVAYDNPINYITAAGGITPTFTHPWMYVMGSNANITISADPQIIAGTEGQQLTLVGAGSTITLTDGAGLALAADRPFRVGSNSIITFYYTSGAAVWQETSRTKPGGD